MKNENTTNFLISWSILCGGLIFVSTATTVASIIALANGHFTPIGVTTGFILGLILGLWAAIHSRAENIKNPTGWETLLLACFMLAAFKAFIWVIYINGDNLMLLSHHNLGDMPLHLNIINRFSNGGDFWPQNPFLAGAIFPYHPGADIFNAMLQIIGIPAYNSLKWVGVIGALAAATALWYWGRGFAVAAFLFSGGLGAITALQTGDLAGTVDTLSWKNIFLTMFVTQRGLLYSIPAGLVLLATWKSELNKNDKLSLPIAGQTALYGTMPLFNAPAFLFLSAVLGACVVKTWTEQKSFKENKFLMVGLLSTLPATWLIYTITAGFQAPSGFRLLLGWLQGEDGILFWIWNFGIFLPLLIITSYKIYIKRRKEEDITSKIFFGISLLTLIFCGVFAIAPWPWDNTKLLIWGYLGTIPFIWEKVLSHWKKPYQVWTCILLFASGALCLIGGLTKPDGYKTASISELNQVRQMLQDISINTPLATSTDYHHPALILGQQLVMGYDGHLFSMGLPYAENKKNLDALMNSDPNWEKAAQILGAKYLFWGEREKIQWPNSKKVWEKECRQISQSPAGSIYALPQQP